jgi:hypothetical protein
LTKNRLLRRPRIDYNKAYFNGDVLGRGADASSGVSLGTSAFFGRFTSGERRSPFAQTRYFAHFPKRRFAESARPPERGAGFADFIVFAEKNSFITRQRK